MVAQHIILLVINVLGGIAVIGSYILGLNAQSDGVNVLWGGVPVGIRPVYTVSMIISAIGYFAFLYFIFFKLTPDEVLIANRFGFWMFYVIFLLILIPSALWMPLTNVYVGNPIMGMKFIVRTVLVIVGLASIALVWALLTLQTRTPAVPYWLAVGGSAYFAFHTMILDGIIWSALLE
ncbi:MAG: hypothetical protein JSU79_08220 [Dehalococcoidales bacterium]|nr:MAG: hypothetical protein JSU79_08220 [Dehalococcoidales bacterium]